MENPHLLKPMAAVFFRIPRIYAKNIWCVSVCVCAGQAFDGCSSSPMFKFVSRKSKTIVLDQKHSSSFDCFWGLLICCGDPRRFTTYSLVELASISSNGNSVRPWFRSITSKKKEAADGNWERLLLFFFLDTRRAQVVKSGITRNALKDHADPDARITHHSMSTRMKRPRPQSTGQSEDDARKLKRPPFPASGAYARASANRERV
jgi:hypothetical protein